MLYSVSNALKKKFVYIIQDIVNRHPIFKKAEVYTKFPEEDRPKTAVIVHSVSGSSLKLGLDNFVAMHHGYCMLANLKGTTGYSIEWVREDPKNLKNLSSPGFYIVKIVEQLENKNRFKFVVEPYLNVLGEELDITFIKGKEGAVLKNKPVNPDSEIIFSRDNGFDFKKMEYSIDYETSEILFKEKVSDEYGPIYADYQVLSERSKEFEVECYELNNTAIPGVILAFGDRLKVGDEQVVAVEKEKRPVSKVFGGRWNLNVDIICLAQDPDQQERLIDYIITSLWAEYQDSLVNEGIHLSDFSLSGEAEDLEIEIPEEYSFTAGISFLAETDWEVHMPLISEVRRINYTYRDESFKDNLDYLTEENYETGQYDKRMLKSDHQKGLQITPALDSYQIYPSLYKRVTRKYT